MRIQYLFVILSAIFLFSCGPSEDEIFMEDTEEIISYLVENNLMEDAEVTSSGIYYIIDNPGDEDIVPTLNSSITCNYKGYFPDGNVFDETNGNSITFTLGNTIEGWRQGIRLIGEGGSIQLFIPSKLAYGPSGASSIPGNQVIFFDVDLIKVN